MTHVNTIQKSSQTYTMEQLEQLVANKQIDMNNVKSVSVFNASVNTADCKDGKDDGKIGFFEGLKETVTGAVKGVVNGIKGCFTDENGKFSLGKTLKTALTVGACFIPGVGPVIAGGMCAYGAVKGATGLAKGISAAANATTDAEKRAAFQSIGGNAVATGLSVAGLKGSAGAIAKNAGVSSITAGAGKGIIGTAKNVATNIGKSATNYYGSAWSAASGTTAQKLGQVAKGTLKDTGSNMVAAAKQAGNAVKNTKLYKKAQGAASKGVEKFANSKTYQKMQNYAENKIADSINSGKFEATYNKTAEFMAKHPKITNAIGKTVTTAGDILSTPAGTYTNGFNAQAAKVAGVAIASHQTTEAAEDLTNNIATAGGQFATVDSQTGYEYDLEDYTIMSGDMLDKKLAQYGVA